MKRKYIYLLIAIFILTLIILNWQDIKQGFLDGYYSR